MPYPKTKREERVLAWINRVRKALYRKPRKTIPKGVLESTYLNPISRATYLSVWEGKVLCGGCLWDERRRLRKMYDITFDGRNLFFMAPKYIQDFIHDFNEGKFPHLIEE